MSLLFSESLAGGDAGNFDVEVIGDGISYANNEAALTIATADADTYLQCSAAIPDSTPQLHFKFETKLDDLTLASTNRAISFFSIFDGNQQVIWLEFKDSSLDGGVDSIRVNYQRNGANFAENFLIDITGNVYSEVEVFFQEQYETGDSGRVRVIFDGLTVVDISLSDQHISRKFIDKVSFGNDTGSNTAIQRILYFKNIEIAPTSAFNSGADDYFVNPKTGNDANIGTSESPLKNAGPISKTMMQGETLTFMDGGAGSPHRLIAGNNGVCTPLVSGTTSTPVTLTGNGVITTCHGVGPSQLYELNASSSNGEYFVTLPVLANPTILSPSFIAIGSNNDDFADMPRIYANGSIVGSLNEGEFSYGDNDGLGFNVVYYKPRVTEDVNTIRIEVNRNSVGVEFSTNYTILDGLVTRMCGTGLRDSGSALGSIITNCDAGYTRTYAIQSDGGTCDIRRNEAHNSQSHVLGSTAEVGGGITNTSGSTSLVQGNFCHDNADDGMDVEGIGTAPKIYGNLLINNGYNSTDGTGLEVASNVTGCDVCNNTTSGNSARGLSFAANVPTLVINNILINEISTGLWFGGAADMSNYTTSNNSFFGNPTDVNDSGAVGSYVPLNDISLDPLLNADFSLSSDSPCVGAGVQYWGTSSNPVGRDGKPFSNVDTDIGWDPSEFSPFHPVNL